MLKYLFKTCSCYLFPQRRRSEMFNVGQEVCLNAALAEAEGRDPAARYTVVGRADNVSVELDGLGWRTCTHLYLAPDPMPTPTPSRDGLAY